MWKKLKSWFKNTTSNVITRGKTNPIEMELPENMDPNFANVIKICFTTGKPVRGYYNEEGKFITEIIEDNEKN